MSLIAPVPQGDLGVGVIGAEVEEVAVEGEVKQNGDGAFEDGEEDKEQQQEEQESTGSADSPSEGQQ